MRKERIVKQSSLVWSMISIKLTILSKILNEMSFIYTKIQYENQKQWNPRVKEMIFAILGCIVAIIVIAFNILHSLVMVLFKALIIWRGYHISLNLPPFLTNIEV